MRKIRNWLKSKDPIPTVSPVKIFAARIGCSATPTIYPNSVNEFSAVTITNIADGAYSLAFTDNLPTNLRPVHPGIVLLDNGHLLSINLSASTQKTFLVELYDITADAEYTSNYAFELSLIGTD